MSSTSIDILSLVISSQNFFEVGKILKNSLELNQWQKKVHLKMLFSNLRKGSLSMTEYFTKLKVVTDALALDGSPLRNIDFINHLITRLDQSYYPIVVYIETKTMDLSKAYAMLSTHEARL